MTGGAVCAAPPARFTTRSQKAATVARRAPPRPLSRDPRDARPGCRRRRREAWARRHRRLARSRRSSRRRPRLSGSALVEQQPRPARSQAACRPLRAVFYAASDWLRLATKLAAARSACAEYYVSVPPLVADKTTFRRDQASRIRALGPSFHAMAEIHFTTWSRWVASTGELMVHRGGHRPRAHGRGRLRRHAGGHVGAQRADDRGPAWRRQRASERPGVPPRTVRGRREQADAGHRPDRRLRSAHERPDRLSEHPSELARGQRVLDRHGDVCQRLVAGGLRRPPRTRGSG